MIIWKTKQVSTGREVLFNLAPFGNEIKKAFEEDEYDPTDYLTYSYEVIEL